MNHVDTVLAHFRGVESNGSGWKCLCPGHPDDKPSLGVDIGDNGGILLHCHAGCTTEHVLEASGLTWGDLFADGVDRHTSSARRRFHVLEEEDYELRHRVYSELLDGLQLHPADHHDLRQRGLSDAAIDQNGYKSASSADLSAVTGTVLRPMFRDQLSRVPGFAHDGFSIKPAPIEGLFIPIRDGAGRIYALEVRTGREGKKYQWFSTRNGESSSGQPVHVPLSFPEGEVRTVRVTEGPLKADVASHLDPTVPILAVASVGAWGQILPTLKTLNPPDGVRLAFDSDWHRKPQVRQQMADFWSAMEKDGLKPVLEDWNEWDGKGIDDLLMSGKHPRIDSITKDKIRPPVESLYPDDGSTHTRLLADVPVKKIDWLWKGWLPADEITILDGDPGVGKSQLVCQIIKAVTRGKVLAGEDPKTEKRTPGNVLVLSAEDDPGAILRPRLEAVDADLGRVLLWENTQEKDAKYSRMPAFPTDEERLAGLIRRDGIRLVVVDPLYSYTDAKRNVYHDTESRAIMNSLARVVQDTGTAVLVLRHLNKAQGQKALYRGSGNIGVAATARVVWLMGRHYTLTAEQRVLAMEKNNYSRFPPSLKLEIKPFGEGLSLIDFVGTVLLSADDLTASPNKKEGFDSAAEFLKEILANGPMPAKTVESMGKKHHFTINQLIYAKETAGVTSVKVADAWEWSTAHEPANDS